MSDGRVHCYLCPRHCHIGEGQSGFCFIRVNQGGKLYSLGYASPAALQIDPIEKKPLNHFLPGTRVFSLGTAGCNMGCFFCQNWDISKSKSDQVHSTHIPPEDVVALAIRNGCPSIAFTYNEPTIWGEYVIDICHAAREAGISTVMVTNGYVTREAFHDIYDHVDAANVDLKAFTEGILRPRHPYASAAGARYAHVAQAGNECLVRDHESDYPHAERRPARNPSALRMDFGASRPRCSAAFHGVSSRFQTA